MDVLGIGLVRTIILFLFPLSIYFGVSESQEELSVRILEGPREGRVEIFHDDVWKTVSLDGWAETEATVVCRQLGFDGPAVAKDSGSAVIPVDVPVLSVDCSDDDNFLTDCEIIVTEGLMFDASLDYLDDFIYWNHNQNAGVECTNASATGSNVVTIIINVVGVLVVIGLIVFFGSLFYRLLNKRYVAKAREAEKGQPESVSMYSTWIPKDHAGISEDEARQYCSVNPIALEPENSYATSVVTDIPQQA